MAYVTTTQLNNLSKNIQDKTLYTKDSVSLDASNIELIKGNLNKYSFVDFINDLSYKPPTIILSHNLSTLVYEKGITVRNGISLSASITIGSEDIQQVEFFKDGISVSLIATGVTTGGTFTYADGTDINIDTKYEVAVTTVKGKVHSESLEIKFYNPYFYGTTPKDIGSLTDSDIKSLTKDIAAKGNKEYRFTANNEFCVCAYPKAYGTLTSLKDENQFENIYSFNRVELNIDGEPYYVYVNDLRCSCTNFKYTFIL